MAEVVRTNFAPIFSDFENFPVPLRYLEFNTPFRLIFVNNNNVLCQEFPCVYDILYTLRKPACDNLTLVSSPVACLHCWTFLTPVDACSVSHYRSAFIHCSELTRVIRRSAHVRGIAVTEGRVRSGSQGHGSLLDAGSAAASAAPDTGRIASRRHDGLARNHVRRVITDNNWQTNRRQPLRAPAYWRTAGNKRPDRAEKLRCLSVIGARWSASPRQLVVIPRSPGLSTCPVHLLFIKRRWGSLLSTVRELMFEEMPITYVHTQH